MPVEALTSDKAEKQHGINIEAWGDSMALQIGRLCRQAEDNGMKPPGVICPVAP